MKLLFSILFLCAFFTAFTQYDAKKDTSIYPIRAKLIKAEVLPPGCGVIAWAIGEKFEIIESNIPEIKKGIIFIVQSCPEFLGSNFFKKTGIYDILVGRHNDASFSYSILNGNDKEKLEVFWSREIKLAD